MSSNAGDDPGDRLSAFGQMESWLWRGGQPARLGYEWLSHRGARVIVNLRRREEPPDMAKYAPDLEPVHIPVKNHRAPSDEQIRQWLFLCRHRSDRDIVFIHCDKGIGRASTFAAAVRLAQGWSAEHAIQEQQGYGFPDSERAQHKYLFDLHRRIQSGAISVPHL